MQRLVNEALRNTKAGLDLLLEASQLCDGAMNMKIDEDFRQLVEEITEKQKRAVENIQNAMQIEKSLLKTQSDKLMALMSRL